MQSSRKPTQEDWKKLHLSKASFSVVDITRSNSADVQLSSIPNVSSSSSSTSSSTSSPVSSLSCDYFKPRFGKSAPFIVLSYGDGTFARIPVSNSTTYDMLCTQQKSQLNKMLSVEDIVSNGFTIERSLPFLNSEKGFSNVQFRTRVIDGKTGYQIKLQNQTWSEI